MISLNIEKTLGFISKENVFAYEAQVKAAQEALSCQHAYCRCSIQHSV